MEQLGYETPARLDAIFSALADPTRRAILNHLRNGDATVGELAAPFDISQPAISKHLKTLERAGLISRDVNRQTRPAHLEAAPMAAALAYLETYRAFWQGSFDKLDTLLETLKAQDKGTDA